MDAFTPREISEIDQLWRSLPPGHVWTGWAAAGDAPLEILIIRTKAHWRRFPLKKINGRYVLFDERDTSVATATSLGDLLARVEAIPALQALDEGGG